MFLYFKTFKKIMMFFVLFIFSSYSMASAVISGTRVIYPSNSKEVTVKVTNNGNEPILLQSWIDNGDEQESPSSIKSPFVITPPINRVDGGKGQTLRISFIGEKLPENQESIFWLNVLEIPPKSKEKEGENTLQVAFRSRIKLFYRPAGLLGDANEAPLAVLWRNSNNQIEAENPTPYYVNFVNLTVNGKDASYLMIPPYQKAHLALSAGVGSELSGGYVNDYGAVKEFKALVK
ncbi:fimbria/pilus periplasmic chaperone [Providencia rettgeri]